MAKEEGLSGTNEFLKISADFLDFLKDPHPLNKKRV
jgi:hypothetical protein